ncbi:hypothetical protein GCM10025868_14120 [Angustibacter aerolatus]|uniref:Uncharacterized protein n=1 Tax=Angustibacter aerolatus TaxID=1162965 RepID=A0ABQ6JGY7_9ACTN|nr:hypothetical protein GCM10025868_14120 [Angustibacter aerolatus]
MRTASSAETSERPNRARAAEASAAERPAAGEPSAETSAEAAITPKSTPPLSRLAPAKPVTTTMPRPLITSTQRSA